MKIDKNMLDIYSDYLISSMGGATTATQLSELLDGTLSNDKISRFLGGSYQEKGKLIHTEYTSKELWELVKPTVRRYENEDAYLCIDDTIQEKQYSDENDVICWHYDHCFNRQVKGVNLLNFVLHTKELNIPLAVEVIKKTVEVKSIKTIDGIEKEVITRKSPKTKNEMLQETVSQIIKNQVKFKYVLIDSWFGSNDTLEFINNYKKKYVVPLKCNRLVAFSHQEKIQGKWQKLENLTESLNKSIQETPKEVWLQGLDHSVLLIKQVFTNKDDSTGVQYLITNDKEVGDKDRLIETYQKRWVIEEYHKSIKSNLALAKSPTKTVTTQINHFFCSVYAYVQTELLTKTTNIKNHFQLKSKLYLKALKIAHLELSKLRMEFGCER